MTHTGAEQSPPLYRNRDFNLIWTGAALSQFGSMLSLTAYPLLVLALTGSPIMAGVVAAAHQAPNLLVQLPAGAYVDRWNRKTLMIVCDAGRAIVVASIVVAYMLGVISVPQLAVVAFLEGTFSVFHRLAELGAVRNVVAEDQYAAAMSATQVRTFGAAFLARPTAGALFDLSRALPFAGDALTYLISLITTVLTRGRFQQPQSPSHARRSFVEEATRGFRWLWAHSFLRAVSLMVPVTNMILVAMPLAVIVIASEQGTTATGIGVILLGFSIGGLTGSLLAGKVTRRLSLRLVVLGSPWVWGACAALAAVAPHPAFVMIGAAGTGAANAIWNVAVSSFQMTVVPDELIGRVNAAGRLLGSAGSAIGPIAIGVLLETAGGRGGMTGLALASLLLAVAAGLTRALRFSGPISTID
ncbi:MFS transporter [Nonomuraea sp. NPDC050663]|uniref:MFS transporter n=1 Tax=Nonomuraea sp. NPDC050663 TaxID=3364370 RepID=UPI0037AF6E29